MKLFKKYWWVALLAVLLIAVYLYWHKTQKDKAAAAANANAGAGDDGGGGGGSSIVDDGTGNGDGGGTIVVPPKTINTISAARAASLGLSTTAVQAPNSTRDFVVRPAGTTTAGTTTATKQGTIVSTNKLFTVDGSRFGFGSNVTAAGGRIV